MCGESQSGRRERGLCRDHPRVCEEKAMPTIFSMFLWESPPRMRGKAEHGIDHRNQPRITPACAGKRESRSDLCRPSGDHPRTCGEKARIANAGTIGKGSPPRVRGKDLSDGESVIGSRITPARAGKSFGDASFLSSRGDHPRACGEKFGTSGTNNIVIGSPLRVRGKEGQAWA